MSGVAYTRHVSRRDERIPLIDRGEVQNVRSSRVYVFGDANSEDFVIENGGIEMSEVRTRGKGKKTLNRKSDDLRRSQTVERDILPSDSLQSFALQYGCTVGELKQANNLYADQEFYALRKLKVPIRPNGVLSEALEEQKRRPTPLNLQDNHFQASGSGETADLHCDDTSEADESECEVRTLSIRSALDSPNSFLRHMDNDLKKICQSTSVRKDNLEEVARTLTVNCIRPLKKQERNHGTFCGLGWKGFLVVALLVAVLVPLIVAWYIYCRVYADSKQLPFNICWQRK